MVDVYTGRDGLTYTLDGTALTISGTGPITAIDFCNLYLSDSSTVSLASITSVDIQPGITAIGEVNYSSNDTGFRGCTELSSVSFPSSLTAIGRNVFAFTTSLTTLTIPSTITTIGESAFYQGGITDIAFESSTISIDDSAFMQCASLSKISILGTNISIGPSAFYYCTNLTNIYLQATPVSIGSNAFSLGKNPNNTTRCRVESPNNVANGALDAYKNAYTTFTYSSPGEYIGADGLSYVFLNNNLTITGAGASTSLVLGILTTADNESVDMRSMVTCSYGADITSILSSTFGSLCTSLTSITVDENNANYSSADGVLFNKDKTTLIKCPAAKTGSYAIPNTVTTISSEAFYTCPDLTSISVPSTVTELPYRMLMGCTSLSSVSIPNTITSLGGYVFSGCTSLQTITLPDTVTTLGHGVFYECTALTTIYLSNNITSIGSHLFANCTALTSAVLPNGLTTLPSETFRSCSSLEYITIPNTVTSIGASAFSNCTSLSFIVIPSGVASIGDRAFYGCSGLKSLILPLENNIVGSTPATAYIWDGCENIETVAVSKATASAYDYTSENYQYLPWYISRDKFKTLTFGSRCVKVPAYAFYSCTTLETVTLPESLITIGSSAFYDCSALKEITVPIDVQWAALSSATHIQTVNYLVGTTGVGVDGNSSPWQYTSASLIAVTFEQGITKIGNHLLDGCSVVNTALDLPDVETIGVAAFKGCSSILELSLGSSIQTIKDEAFRGCTQMQLTTDLGLADLTTIGSHAFDGCENLVTDLTIPVNVVTLGDHAFTDCTSIETVSMERVLFRNNVSSPPEGCFAGCTALKTIDVTSAYTGPVNVGAATFYTEMFMGCTSLEAVPTVGSSAAVYHNARCFKGCTSLTALSFDYPTDTTIEIGASAFEDCTGLQTIEFICGFHSIGANAFKGCIAVALITFRKDLGSGAIGVGAFMLGLDEDNEVYATVRSYNYWANTTLETEESGEHIYRGEYTHFNYLPMVDYYIGRDDGHKYMLSADGTLTVTYETSSTSTTVESFDHGTLYVVTNEQVTSDTVVFGSSLKKLIIGNSITGIADDAFWHTSGVTALQEVSYTNSTFEIGQYSFRACAALTTVKALTAGSTISMESYAFMNCTALVDVDEIGEYTTLDAYVFDGCTGLTQITFPESASAISRAAFDRCTSLVEFNVDPDNVTYSASQGILYNLLQTELVIYPPGLRNESYSIPEGVERVGESAFADNHFLTSITFPTTLTSIGVYAFKDCYNITSLYFKGATPVTFSTGAFGLGTASHPVTTEVRSYDDWADNMLEAYADQYTTFVYITTGFLIHFISTEGEIVSETLKTHTNGVLDAFPPMPERTEELIFLGWSDTQQYDVWTPVTAPHTFTENTTLYAKWRDIPFTYSMIFVLAPGTVEDINVWKVTPLLDSETTLGSWRELTSGVYRWGYEPEQEDDGNLAITLTSPTNAQINIPDGMSGIDVTGDRWYSLAPYVPIESIEQSLTLTRRGVDGIYAATFYPNWVPARVSNGSRALMIAPGKQMLDFGEIQSITKTYRASNTVIPIMCYGYRRSFVMDLGTSMTVNLKYIRVQPKDWVPNDDLSGDSRRWSNNKWASYLREYVDRWQMRTNGQILYILNPGNANGDPPERFPDNAMREVNGANCYIANAPISYGDAGPDVISSSIEFDIGTLYPKKETPVMKQVTFYLGGEYASHWGEVQDKVLYYPEGGIIILPEYPWGTTVEDINVSGSGYIYNISGWKVPGITEAQMPGAMVHVPEGAEIEIYADTAATPIRDSGENRNYFKTDGNDYIPPDVGHTLPQFINIYGEITISINDGYDFADVNIILVGGGGGGSAAKTVKYSGDDGVVEFANVLIIGGAGGGAGEYKTNFSDSARRLYRTVDNNGSQTYYFKLGQGGGAGVGTENVYSETGYATKGDNGVDSTVSIIDNGNTTQLMRARGGYGGSLATPTSNSYYKAIGGQGAQYSGGDSGGGREGSYNYYMEATVNGGAPGGGAWNVGGGRDYKTVYNTYRDNRTFVRRYFASGSGGGAGLSSDVARLFANAQPGNGGDVIISPDTNNKVKGGTATHGCGGGGGGIRLVDPGRTPTAFPDMCNGSGGNGGRGFMILYVVGGKITAVRYTGHD